MFLKNFFIFGIEKILNILLYSFPTQSLLCQKLNGKIIRINIKGLSIPLTLIFGKNQLNILSGWEGKTDCSISIHMSELPNLRCRQKLASLICKGALEMEGDLQVVDNFIGLTDLAGFDLVELLVPYIGDIAAEGIKKVLLSSSMFLYKGMKRQERYIADILTEEWHIAPARLEVAWFTEEISTIDRAVEAFGKRLRNRRIDDSR